MEIYFLPLFVYRSLILNNVTKDIFLGDDRAKVKRVISILFSSLYWGQKCCTQWKLFCWVIVSILDHTWIAKKINKASFVGLKITIWNPIKMIALSKSSSDSKLYFIIKLKPWEDSQKTTVIYIWKNLTSASFARRTRISKAFIHFDFPVHLLYWMQNLLHLRRFTLHLPGDL